MDQVLTPPSLDFADARKRMVDSQIRPSHVSDPRILAAMRDLPREKFVPPAQTALAYADADIPLDGGRFMAAPLAIARLVQLAAPESGERALVVGAGTGYGAALLAACGARVTALEENPSLVAIARLVLPALAPGVALAVGPLAGGWKDGAPYDIILIEGAVHAVPPAIAAQLRPMGGRLVTVRAGRGLASQAVLAEATMAGLNMRDMFDCALPALLALLPQPGFVF
jgi:protein-L-isoaspartate(D-aspartate) O-methyltransferase